MKHTHLIALLVISLFATACGAAPATAEATPIIGGLFLALVKAIPNLTPIAAR